MISPLIKTAQYWGMLFLLLQICFAQTDTTPPKPTINVSFSKQVIRENDQVSVEVLFTNDSEDEITEALLKITSLPNFIRVSDKPCEEKSVTNTEPTSMDYTLEPKHSNNIGSIKNVRSRNICLTTGSDIHVGDYNILFAVDYQWVNKGKTKQSRILAEKTLKVNFFGSDSIAGVPLALAGLIVPGLFFWLTLRLFGVSWGIELALGDKLIYSVIISLILIASAFGLKSFSSAGFLRHLDISDGMSIEKLLWLALIGFVVGLAVVLIYAIVRYRQKVTEKDTKIYRNDPAKDVFKKLLKRHRVYNPSPWRRVITLFVNEKEQDLEIKIIDRQNIAFIGALGSIEPDFTVAVGWYSIKCPSGNANLKKIRKFETKRQFYKLFKQAEQDGLTIYVIDQVKKKQTGRDDEQSGESKTWNNDDVSQITPFPRESRNLCLSVEII